jgi:hypothetical protein
VIPGFGPGWAPGRDVFGLRTDQAWVDIRPVNRTVWTNHTLQPVAERHLRTELERRVIG